MVQWMKEQWNSWHEIWQQQGYGDSVKPIIPIGQGWDLSTSQESEEIIRFCTLIYDHGYSGVSLWEYGGMTPENWQDYNDSFSSPLTIRDQSPVDLIVTDPNGLNISKQLNEIPSAVYAEVDIMGSGDPEDKVIIPRRKIGDYLITVVPEPNVLPTDTYSLEAVIEGQTMILAQNVQVQDIPAEPYIVESKLCYSDFDTDGDVDFADLNKLTLHWLDQDCNYPIWCEGTDLNYNHSVDFIDFGLFAENWLWEKIIADLNIDGDVDFKDYAAFANRWMDIDCNEPDWCFGADLNKSTSVDFADLAKFTEHWLEQH
jgi:hypothetical protein